jgi:hypothetical protein
MAAEEILLFERRVLIDRLLVRITRQGFIVLTVVERII